MQRFFTLFIGTLLATLATSNGAYGQESEAENGFQKLSRQQTLEMRAELCMSLQTLRNEGDTEGWYFNDAFTSKLIKYSKVSRDDEEFWFKLAQFWNYHSPRMICGPVNATYPKQHLFMRAFEMNMQLDVLEGYFLVDENSFPIDPNVIEFHTDGSSSTIIDYIDSMLNDPKANERYHVQHVRGIRELLVDLYGAKSVSDLPAEDRATRMALAKEQFRIYGSPSERSDQLPTRLEIPADCTAPRFSELHAYAIQRQETLIWRIGDHDVAELEPLDTSCFDHEIFGALIRAASSMKITKPYGLFRDTQRYVIWYDVDESTPTMSFIDSGKPTPMERLSEQGD